MRTTRRLTAVGAIAFAMLVWTGTAMAVTTAPQGDGGTILSGGTPPCTAAVQAPASQNVEHTDGDDVILPLYEHVNDLRPPNSPTWTSRFQVVTDYQGTQSNTTHNHATDGDVPVQDYLNHTVPNVSESTSMDVTYNVWVLDENSVVKCSDSDTATFTFV